jgi:hypothetical protein
LEGRADDIDQWTGQYSQDFAYIVQKVRALEATEPKEVSSKVAAHLEEIIMALLDREMQCRNSGQKWDYMHFGKWKSF